MIATSDVEDNEELEEELEEGEEEEGGSDVTFNENSGGGKFGRKNRRSGGEIVIH